MDADIDSGEYGLRAMFYLAPETWAGPIPLKTIAEEQGISEHYLEQLMGALRRSGLVSMSGEPKVIFTVSSAEGDYCR